jgi:EAL domain-containing protein (putative c-di-GMP-specific phosphodiesterase class I)
MFLLTVCTLVSISLVSVRFGLSTWWRRSTCFKCSSHSIFRKKRTRKDRLLGKILSLPLERYTCNHYQCTWEGLLIYPSKTNKTKLQKPNIDLNENLNFVASFEDGISIDPPEWFASEQNLIGAFERNEFMLYYQPSINLENKSIDGLAALLRWQHPERGIIYPKAFIPVADDNDFIFLLGQWVLTQACHQLQEWHEKGLYPLRISVNLSVRQFYQFSLLTTIVQVLEQTGLNPGFLEIEVSEQTIMQNLELASSILSALQSIGVRITMDNLGLGNMPHRHLRRLALDTVKIDRTLIHNLNAESEHIELIRTYVLLGQSLNLEVIAEGVETREEFQALRSLGCEKGQGYLFDRPLSAGDATDVLKADWLDRQARAASSANQGFSVNNDRPLH